MKRRLFLLIIALLTIFLPVASPISSQLIQASELQTPQTGDRHVLVLLQGIGSTSLDYLSPGGTFGEIAQTLGFRFLTGEHDPSALPYDDILFYSYKGHQRDNNIFTPVQYGCSDTFRQDLATDASRLKKLLEEYTQAYPGTQFDLVGHSLGGLVAWEYSKSRLGGNIDTVPRVRDVITCKFAKKSFIF